MSLETEWPNSSWISAITTLAPCFANSLAVDSPMPLAPPVINATFPSNLFFKLCLTNQITVMKKENGEGFLGWDTFWQLQRRLVKHFPWLSLLLLLFFVFLTKYSFCEMWYLFSFFTFLYWHKSLIFFLISVHFRDFLF